MTRTRLFPYPEQRVLEDAAFARGVTPTRIFGVLLPVWCVTIQADVTEAEDYELIDRYLARGIAEGGLSTTAGLADFYALESELVDRALRALGAIGHVTRSADGRWALTTLGLRSVQDRKRYVVTREDRRKLYFDAFGSRPLPRPCYDTRRVTMIPAAELPAGGLDDGPRFHALHSTRGFDHRALGALAANPRRDRFNLPERIDRLRELDAAELVFLPLHVVRGADRHGRIRLLAYGQAAAEADPDLGDLLDATPEVLAVLDAELSSARPQDVVDRAREWLRRRDLGDHRPERLPNGLLRVGLPATAFGDGDRLPSHRVGSFVVQGNGFFQLWCDDVGVRRRALLGRVDALLAARSRVDRDQLLDRVRRMAVQLDLGEVGLPDVRRWAEAAGRRGLAAQLDRIR